jgi:hypothetical protein
VDNLRRYILHPSDQGGVQDRLGERRPAGSDQRPGPVPNGPPAALQPCPTPRSWQLRRRPSAGGAGAAAGNCQGGSGLLRLLSGCRQPPRSEFLHPTTADHLLTLPSADPNLAADIAALNRTFGAVEVIDHQKITVPGSAAAIDLRAQAPHGIYSHPMLRLDAGRYPGGGTNEIAVTAAVAKIFNLHVGGSWHQGGRDWPWPMATPGGAPATLPRWPWSWPVTTRSGS